MAFISSLPLLAHSRTHAFTPSQPALSIPPKRSVRTLRISTRAHAGCADNRDSHANSIPARSCDADAVLRLVKFNERGLVPAVAQQWDTKEVLMMAWMNEESLRITVNEQRAVYYSRSRAELWRKGESSGNVQTLHDLIVDCDGDTVLLLVDQEGPACHTGRRSCFYFAVRDGKVEETSKPLRSPEEMYGANAKK